jgi:hypothetical protein
VVPRGLAHRDGAHLVSGASLAAAGVYLFLRVMFACNGCVASGYGASSPTDPVCPCGALRSSCSDIMVLDTAVARDIVQQQHLAIAAALLAAGSLDALHGKALRERRLRSGRSRAAAPNPSARIAAFEADWVHDGWFGSIAAIGLIFIAHPQADAHNALIHVTIGVALVLGAHAIVGERRNGFMPKLVLANAAVDGESTVAAPAAMDAIDVAPRGMVTAGACFVTAAIGLAAFQESESEHVGVDVACSPAGWALVVGTESWALCLLLLAGAAWAFHPRLSAGSDDMEAEEEAGQDEDAAVFG